MSERDDMGSWKVVGNSWQYTTIYGADGAPICRMDLEDWGVTEDNQEELEEKQATIARLIAAAPVLLEALLMAEELASLKMPGDPATNIAFVRDYRRRALALVGEPSSHPPTNPKGVETQ